MRRKSDRVKTPVAASPAKRSSRRSKRSASDTEEKPQNSDNEQSEQNSGSEQDSDHQPVAKNRRKLSRNTKAANEDKPPTRGRRGRPAKNIETVAEEDEEPEAAQQIAVTAEENSVDAEKEKTPEPAQSPSPAPAKVKSPEPVKLKSPEPARETSPEPETVKSPDPVKAKSPEPVTVQSPVKPAAKETTPDPEPVVEAVQSPELETKSNAEAVDCPVEADPAQQSEQNNGSSKEAGEQVEESKDKESKTRSKATGRRKHRKSSSENVELQPTEAVKESPRKRRNRFSSPGNEQDNEMETDETNKVADKTASSEDVVTPIHAKSSELEVVKDVDKSQDCDGRKSRGEKENKRKSDEKTVSSEKKPKPVRKRKWLTQKSTEPKPQILAISTDSLKNLISDVKPVPLSDVRLESSPEPDDVQIVSKNDTAKSNASSNDRSHRNKEQRTESKPDKKHDENTSMSTNRKISIVSDETTVQRPPSPPKFTSSNILFITNLVRPFTVLQLKGLLARTGKIVDDGFWIDKIKSKCYVKYETEDEAIETRHALHGVRWPASNPKCLNVDFGSEKNMEKAIASTSEQPPKEGVAAVREERVSGGWDRFEVDERKETSAASRPMREWDVGKKEDLGRERGEKERERDRGDRNRDRERDREHPKESREADRLERRKRTPDIAHSVSPPRKFHKKENEPPIRLLDDLFRKTKTTPCVYWLPLTSEQIAVKEEERRKQQAEQKRRIEQREKERNERNERDRERDRNRGDRDRSDRDRDRDRRRY